MTRLLAALAAAAAAASAGAPAALAAGYADTVLATPGLAHYWRFEEEPSNWSAVDAVTGASASTSAVRTPGATDDGGRAWTPGTSGGGIRPYLWADDFLTAMTFEAWARPVTVGVVQALVGPDYQSLDDAVGASLTLE